jgi:predicted membrane channel-forming protein YqfA (hemolysin III family)
MPDHSFRRRAGALSLVALFPALLVSTAIDPLGDNHDNTTQLHNAIGHSGAVVASAALELLAAALAPVAVLWLVQLVNDRGRVLANIGGVLGIAGALGMALIGLHELFIAALADTDPAHGTAILDRLDHLAGPVVVLFFGVPIALVLLAIAAHRAHLVPTWVPALAGLFFIADFTPIPEAEIIQLLLGLAAFGTIAFRALRTPTWSTEPAAAS